MDDLFTAIIARLTDDLVYHGLNADLAQPPAQKLKYVDMDWGQLDNYPQHPPAGFPCALLDVRSLNYSDAGNQKQIGLADIEVRIADVVLNNSSSAAPATQRANALRNLRLYDAVFQFLHGWVPPNIDYGPLTRISGSRTKRADGIREMRMVFRVQIPEFKAAQARNLIKVSIV